MPNTTLFILIEEKEITYIRNKVYLDDTNRVIDKLYHQFNIDKSSKNFKEIVYKLCLSLNEDNMDFKKLDFELGNSKSGTLIFDLASIQEENEFYESIVIFNTLDIEISLRSINYNIDGKLVKPNIIWTYLTAKTSL